MKRIGIIGLGVVGQRLIKQFKDSLQFKIVSICDVNEDILKATVTQIGKVATFKDYKELIEISNLDLVYIAVPPALHKDIAIYAMKKGIHVLCEKPLANTLLEAEQMKNIAKEEKVINAIHFPLAYSFPFELMKEMVQKGEFGQVIRATLKMHFHQWPRPWQQTNWIGKRIQGGFIREIMPHYLQMLIHLFGVEAEVTHCEVTYPADGESSETSLVATIKWNNGLQLIVDGSVGQAEQEHIQFTIHGTEASVSLENWREFKIAKKGEPFYPVELYNPKNDLLNELSNSIDGTESFIINFEEGYYVQQLLETILERN